MPGGTDALKGKKQFDLIFMDMHMPVMDGLEATEKILELNSGVPIVAMTANIMSHDKELYKASGMNDYVGKPFTSQELWRCLMKYFKPLNWQTEDKDQYENANNELRKKLINSFVEKNKEKFGEIADAINAGNIKLAHRLVHTLKSNAGQLNMTLLQQAADEVEYCLKDGKNTTIPEQMALLEKELNSAITELLPLVQDSEQYTETEQALEPFDKETALELFEELESLLKDDNTDCLNFTASLRQIPGSEELIRQIEDFNFTLAVGTLADLKQKASTL